MKLIMVLAITYSWAILKGLWANQHLEVIRLKSHGRKAISIFRYGLDHLQESCFAWLTKITRPLKKLLRLNVGRLAAVILKSYALF